MSNIELVEKCEKRSGNLKKLMNKKLLKNQKGFSLVELLIVIAIMGVLAVIAFNMFGGVLTSSKKRADEQQADNLGRAVLAYCIETNDWDLSKAKTNAATPVDLDLDNALPKTIFEALSAQVNVNSKVYGPYVTLKDPTQTVGNDANKSIFVPQSSDFHGWKLTIYSVSQTVKCEPITAATETKVSLETK